MTQQNIFYEVKEHLKSNPYCLSSLFPTARLKGHELYFDSPSYNSWSYNIHKGIAKDFRSNERQDIIDTYKKCHGMTSSYEAAKEMARKLNITIDNKNRTMKKQDSGDVNQNNVILEQSKDIFQESYTNDSQMHSNTELTNNQAKEEKYITAKAELNKMIKSSSNSYEELRNHLYSQKKQLEPNAHNGQLSIGRYKNGKAIYVPAFKVGSEDIKTVQFITEDAKDNKRWHSGIDTKGVFYPMGIKAIEVANCDEVILCEGLATGEKIYSSIDKEKPVLSCFSKSNVCNVIDDIKKSNSEIKIIIACDGDTYEEMKKKLNNYTYSNLYICKPCLTEAEQREFREYEKGEDKHADFWDLRKVGGSERVKEELKKIEECEGLIPIEFSLDQVEPTDIDFLGDNIIVRFAKEVSRSTETPLEFALFGVFSAISTCVMGKVFVKIKEDYIEPIILSTIIIAKSGEGKSPVYNQVMKPILEKEKEYRKEYKNKHKEWQHANLLIDDKIKKLKGSIAGGKNNQNEVNIKDIMDIEAERVDEPIDPTITAQDITPEQITTKLVKQGGKIAVIDHEGGIFNIIAGQYNNKGAANTDVFTKGYNGSGLKVDRKDKSIDLDSTYVLLLIFLQPDIFKRINNFEHFIGSGFFARALFLCPKSRVEFKTHEEPAVNTVIKNEYSNFIQGLMSYEENNDNYKHLQLSNEAQEMYINFCTDIAKERAIGGDFEYDLLGGWAEKLKGNTARLAGVLHIIDNPQINNIVNTEISKETLGKAIELSDILIEHAQAIFNSIGVSKSTQDAIDLWKYIESKKLYNFSGAEILQRRRKNKRFEKKENMTLALEVLAERFFISKVENFRNNNIGNQPSPNYKVNKNIIKKWQNNL